MPEKERDVLSRILKASQDNRLVFYGCKKKARDLEFVFQIRFSLITENKEDIRINDFEKYNIIFAYAKQAEAEEIIAAYRMSSEQYCYDESLFEYLNMELCYRYLSGSVAIWGTGEAYRDFCTKFKKISLKDKINYFISTCPDQTQKDGIPVLTPAQVSKLDCKIIIAVNYKNFYEIEKECEQAGISRERYIYYQRLMDNPGVFLRKTYYDDSYYPVICMNRDQTIRIHRNGNVCMCCLSAEMNILGNIYEQSFRDVWNSVRARIGRLSIVNHTYTFCDHFRCPFLRGAENCLGSKDYNCAYHFQETDYPLSIAPEVDASCNLYCTSCRNHIFVEKGEEFEFWVQTIKDKLFMLPVLLVLNTVGEPFASPYCLDLLEHMETAQCKPAIYTNGTLLTSERLDGLLKKYPVLELSMSIDGATKNTYEKIRRGANYEKLRKNIAYISEKKKEGQITYWRVTFVVQRDNVKELKEFVKQAEEWGVDEIFFQEIENWGVYKEDEYQAVRVTRDHRIKKEYKKYFSQELILNPKIHWGNLSYVLGVKGKFARLT